MASSTPDLAERRSRVIAAREALAGLDDVLHEASGAELAELMGLVDDLAAAGSAARVTVAVEATRRGEAAGSEVQAWVRENARSLRQGGAASVARIAVDVAAATGLTGAAPEACSPIGIVWNAVRLGRVEAGTGCAVLREARRLDPLLRTEAVPTVTSALVDLAERWGPSMMRRLRPQLLAEHGHDGALDDLQQRLASAARLSMPHVESGDLTEYQLWMTPEQAATLEAAIGPSSAPAPNGETGEPDLRPAGQRRVEALTELCRAASTTAAEAAGDPSVAGAVLHVGVDLADLEARIGAGEVIGSVADGTIVSPETLRQIACDAAVIPYVLGSAGEVLDVGRLARLFTRAQRRLLRLRDRGCTYPGCTSPPDRARAHHVRHWADGGATDVANAALLCQRHHTTVHRRRLWAQVRERRDDRGRSVVWDLTDGSYDRALTRLPNGPPCAADPGRGHPRHPDGHDRAA
ncbi:HNH endonuclease [Phycicoccus sp. CSK15P-2]|uniref:HNH endonuclease signature motif containing protein n=1 Tax=Phycicoccus sp. CSK15P-2 TaxID=2807627 RepID=UPI00194EE227|nr:HNH endonuclease signature motif containing protein [Phycicoccus sp. CSK15P-2]MBM6405614.1 HNH endonuclease [Phycicoccus sp. CSK15P-2]